LNFTANFHGDLQLLNCKKKHWRVGGGKIYRFRHGTPHAEIRLLAASVENAPLAAEASAVVLS